MLVKPVTVIQWHRQGFRLFWRWRSRSGRPSVEREIRDLIRQMSSANPLWVRLVSMASCSSSASKSAKLRSPSTWCEDEVRLPRPGAPSCGIMPKVSQPSTCSSRHPHRFGCTTLRSSSLTIVGGSFTRPSPNIPLLVIVPGNRSVSVEHCSALSICCAIAMPRMASASADESTRCGSQK